MFSKNILNRNWANFNQGILIKGKEMSLVCVADEFGIPYTHSFGTDTQHDYSQGNWRTMSSIIIKLE